MDINDVIRGKILGLNTEIQQKKTQVTRLENFNPPKWLEEVNVDNCSVVGPYYSVDIIGDMETVKHIQGQTNQFLKRRINPFNGAVYFGGTIKIDQETHILVDVMGDELSVAPGCKLEQYEETITKYKVTCGPESRSEDGESSNEHSS